MSYFIIKKPCTVVAGPFKQQVDAEHCKRGSSTMSTSSDYEVVSDNELENLQTTGHKGTEVPEKVWLFIFKWGAIILGGIFIWTNIIVPVATWCWHALLWLIHWFLIILKWGAIGIVGFVILAFLCFLGYVFFKYLNMKKINNSTKKRKSTDISFKTILKKEWKKI